MREEHAETTQRVEFHVVKVVRSSCAQDATSMGLAFARVTCEKA